MIRLFKRQRQRESVRLEPWSRNRLLATVVAVSLVGLLIVVLLVWSLFDLVRTLSADATPPGGQPVTPVDRRDAIAAEPMASVDRDAAFGAAPAWTLAPAIFIPDPTLLRGPAGVPTGFPRTPEGAVGQLAAIDRTVLEAMSAEVTADVHAAWAQPGAPSHESWVLTIHVRNFLTSAKQGPAKDLTTVVEVVPVGAMVKGTDGPDWVLACVLYDVRASIRTTSRMGYGRCERMQWTTDRWQIAPGTAPAVAPSAWPGSQVAKDAGWLTWTTI